MKTHLIFGLIGFAAAGCAENADCISAPNPAIIVDIRDSVTSQVVALGATVVARDGEFVDSITAKTNAPVGLAENRAGSYSISVRKTGYAPWQQDNVLVASGNCGPAQGSILTALLQQL